MVSGFTKSEEGVKEYSKLGLAYLNEVFDELYEKWLKETSAYELSKYTHHKEKEVTKIVRVKVGAAGGSGGGGNGGKEYIVYSFNHYRLDAALNVKSWWLPNIGKYPLPIPIYETTTMAFGQQQRKISEIGTVETGYSIPFSPKALDKVRDIGLEHDGKVQYLVETPNKFKTSVATYEDLRDEKDFDALVHFGKKPSDKQRSAWLEGEGREKDLERLQEIQRIRQSR